MSNRIFNAALALEKQVVSIFGYINSIGTTITYGGLGVSSVARTGVGLYTITLDDAFDTFLMFNATTINAGNTTICTVRVRNTDSTVQTVFKTKKIYIGTADYAAAAVEPPSNTTIKFEIKARRSSSGKTFSF